jgi:hypothetical protein
MRQPEPHGGVNCALQAALKTFYNNGYNPAVMDFEAQINVEMKGALTARLAGNEGRARVCARRAAGLAARDFLDRHGLKPSGFLCGRNPSDSAYQSLQTLAEFPGLAPELIHAARNLTMRVSGEFKLPSGIDLIAEARLLIGGLK